VVLVRLRKRRYPLQKPAKLLTAFTAFVMFAYSQNQVATATSDGPFQLRGANVTPGQGVPSWPVMPADTIKAGQTPVTIVFQDGSTLVLNSESSARVGLSSKTPVFQLQSGSAHYSLTGLASVKLMELNDTVTPKELTGLLQIGNRKPPAGWWTASHTAVVGAAAAAGLGVGVITATKNGTSVSPSQ